MCAYLTDSRRASIYCRFAKGSRVASRFAVHRPGSLSDLRSFTKGFSFGRNRLHVLSEQRLVWLDGGVLTSMPYQTRIPLPGSDRKPVPGAREIGPVPKDEVVRVTVVLRRRGADPDIASGRQHSREEYGVLHGAAPADLEAV